MGGDGGSIPKRKERVKNSKTNPAPVRERRLGANEKWRICPISSYFIKKPVMAGQWGHLLSKEGLLEFLIKSQQDTLESYHIREDSSPVANSLHSRKDAIELKLVDNPALNEDCTLEEKWMKGEFVCPITGLETNGKHKFVFSWRCGCVVSERALKECASNEKKCLVCEKPYNAWDIVTINPEGKDLRENQAKFMARKMLPIMRKEGCLRNPSEIVGGSSDESSSQESASGKAPDSSSGVENRPGPSTSRSRTSRSSSKRDRSQTPSAQPSTSGRATKRNK